MGYSLWDRKRDGHDLVTKQQYEVTETQIQWLKQMGGGFSAHRTKTPEVGSSGNGHSSFTKSSTFQVHDILTLYF